MIRKLEGFGITGKLPSFLTNRTQGVVLNGIKSSLGNVTSVIPQGSVLGSMLFTIFINDLPYEANNITKLFADDTKIHSAVNNITDQENIQSDLLKLDEWSKTWQLTFNQEKCKHIHF